MAKNHNTVQGYKSGESKIRYYFIFICIFLNRMPAYDNNPWSSLFFVIFIIVCMYIFVSIFLAVVYKNYRKHLKVDYCYVVLNIVYFVVMVRYYFFPSTHLLF